MAVKVTLLTHTPDPEQVVAMAAKLCYSPSGIEDIREGLTEEKTAAFIDMLAGLGHASPTEHASFTFGIEGISRACSHQLVRHRIASYSQQSQRYVDGTKFDFVTPPAIRENPKALEAYNRVLAEQAQAYSAIRDALAAGYIAEYLGEPQEGTDAEIIERCTRPNAPPLSKRRTRTRVSFCQTPPPPKSSAPLMRAACKTSLRTAAATAPSGRSVR